MELAPERRGSTIADEIVLRLLRVIEDGGVGTCGKLVLLRVFTMMDVGVVVPLEEGVRVARSPVGLGAARPTRDFSSAKGGDSVGLTAVVQVELDPEPEAESTARAEVEVE